jgi:acyl-CoA thioesterase-1
MIAWRKYSPGESRVRLNRNVHDIDAPGWRGGMSAILAGTGWLCLFAVLALAAAGGARAADPPCPPASPRHLDLPATSAALAAGKPVTIVAFGSSSTEGTGATAPDRTYPARLEALLRAKWPGTTTAVLNRGMGGQTADAMLARLDADVLVAAPVLVIWQAGANEVLRHTDPALFSARLNEGVRRIAAAGADVVLMDNQVSPAMQAVEDQAAYGAIIAQEAKGRAVSLFSRTALMREWLLAGGSADGMIGRDGIHHTDRGYACLAESLAGAIVTSVDRPPHAGDPAMGIASTAGVPPWPARR